MREADLAGASRCRRRRGARKRAQAPAAPDRVRRVFTATRPRRALGRRHHLRADLGGLALPRVVIDAFSRRCVGWSMRSDLQAELVVDALGMAVTRRRPEPGVVHHSDRGSQYASLAFGATLRESGVLASMGSRGDAYDNAAAESFFSTIKKELIYRHTFKNRNAARLAIFDYIECFYNPVRRHSTLGNISPADYELAAATATS